MIGNALWQPVARYGSVLRHIATSVRRKEGGEEGQRNPDKLCRAVTRDRGD